MSSIAFFPIIENELQLADVLSRAAWHLSFCSEREVSIPVTNEALTRQVRRVAPGMDPMIDGRLDQLLDRVRFVVAKSETDLASMMSDAEVILRWKKDVIPAFVDQMTLGRWEQGKKVWQVDPEVVRMEGSFYIEAGLSMVQDKARLIDDCKAKFDRMATKLGRFERAVLMATGPSISNYRKHRLDDSLNIVCNSVILDDELMSIARPQILVFADPIFHFGPSEYAGAFRASLLLASEKYEFTICVPFKYYPLLVSALPSIADRIIGIPYEKGDQWNFRLDESFSLRSTANILTFLMIPLATTFAREIGLLGCDGRPLSQNNYFWSHNSKTQINDKMENIRKIHPGFFDIDYNDYYLEHCRTLEDQACAAEQAGHSIRSLAFSYIPALRSRMTRSWRCSEQAPQGPVGRVVLLDPDAKSWAGHYMAYNEKLSAELQRQGASVRVACRTDLDPKILAERSNYLPMLSCHSWEVGNRSANGELAARFASELDSVLEHVFGEEDGSVTLYMYCGSLEHVDIIRRAQQRFPELRVNINLFWLSFTLTADSARRWSDLIEWLDDHGPSRGFVATVPTAEIADELAALSGRILPIAPHPSTGMADEDFAKQLDRSARRTTELRRLAVLFPSAPRPEKGYELSVDCARILGQSDAVLPIVRHAPTFSTPKQLARPLENLPQSVKVVTGELDDRQFQQLFEQSDIVVLPYTPEAFSKRTSGLLIDALYHGLPCVVVKGTWLGNIVDKYGCGVSTADSSAVGLAHAVREVARNYHTFRESARRAAVSYFERNSWRSLARHIRTGQVMNSSSPIEQEAPLLGPYNRAHRAHWDETLGVAALFGTTLTGSVMIDVGAHHGSALAPFLNRGWKIWAFEPDEVNRAKLLERLKANEHAPNVHLDPRCVSNRSEHGLAFYRSEQSTGISGLSAFHESHVESQRVDTTTLTEFLATHEVPEVDFLKIDTEGHDLFVLQGFPWDRCKPRVIECEFEDAKTVPIGYTFDDLARYLLDLGYSVYVSEWHPIVRYGIRHDWHLLTRYPCGLVNAHGWGNLLAFRDHIDEKALVEAVRRIIKVEGVCSTAETPPTPTCPTIREAKVRQSASSKMPRFRVIASPSLTQVGNCQWRCVAESDGQATWWAAREAGPDVAGRSFRGGMTLIADSPTSVRVRLARHGDTTYEGSAEEILRLTPGKLAVIRLEHRFAHHHRGLRLQVDILAGSESTALTIDKLLLVETPASVRRRLPANRLNIRSANQSYRSGDLETAMGLYFLLHQLRPLPMYTMNAKAAARKLGLDPDEVIEAMRDCTA